MLKNMKLNRYAMAAAIGFALITTVCSAQTVLIDTNVNDGSFESVGNNKINFSTPVSSTTSIPFWGATLVDVSNNPVGAPSDSGVQLGGNVVEQGTNGCYIQGAPISTAFNLVTNYVIQTGDFFTLTWWGNITAPSVQQVALFSQNPSTVGATWAYQPTATLKVAQGGIYVGTGHFSQFSLTYQATAADAGNLIGVTIGNAGSGYPTFDNFKFTVQAGVLPGTPSANLPQESPTSASIETPAGASVILMASASGTAPISFYWQTDGGSGGALTNIPGAVGSNYVVDTTGFSVGTNKYAFVATNSIGTNLSSTVNIAIVPASTILMLDTGTTNAPTPGANDISQLLNTSQNNDGFNYYTDNGIPNARNGQTFTTGSNPAGYTLNTLYWKSAGGGNSFGTFQPYDLYIYSLSGGTATLVGSYTNIYGGGVENDWFKWINLSTPLAPNSQYAYTFGRDASAGGWEQIGNQGGNPYAGGQICQIAQVGGAVTYGTTGGSDATFDLGLGIATFAFAPQPTYTPNVSPIYAGTPVTLHESGVGAAPLAYQWLTDNGTGGAFSQVGGATSTNLAVNTTAFVPGNYQYEVIVTNTLGNSTSAPVTLNIIAASGPTIVTDINPTANEGYVGQTLTYSATFSGTLPITYQWMLNTGSGFQPISSSINPSATNNTLILTNAQPSQTGTYELQAQNSQSSSPSSSATLTVLALPGPPAAGTYGAAVLSNNPVAYWRFNETEDPSTGVLPAYDATGHGFIGTYGSFSQNGYDGITGPQPPLFPTFETTNTALSVGIQLTNSWVTVPPLNLSTNSATVTITAWIYPTALEPINTGLFFNRVSNAGFGFGTQLNGPGMAELGYVWNNNASSTYNFNSGLFPLENQWSFVALVIQPSGATIYLGYEDPNNSNNPIMLSTNNPVANVPALFNSGVTTIGTDLQQPLIRAFGGSIDEVAVYNTALTPSQIYGFFNYGTGANLVAPIPLTISHGTGGNLILTWSPGTLLQTTNLNGPWTTNSAAVSPYSVAPTGAQMFFRTH
jgi:hypothetical protein